MKKRIVFLTGTRADYGKIKPLIETVDSDDEFECFIYVTGMHTLSRYGMTANEIFKDNFKNVHLFINQSYGEPMDVVLANTISGFSRYVNEYAPDMIVVHGDRVEALAGAIVGSLNNILVSHVEGGELSGSVDGIIRHSISKLAHIHFVSNEVAGNRLKQLGEMPETIYPIGSPDIDVMLSSELPVLSEAKKRYGINFEKYSIVLFHSVTNELDSLYTHTTNLVKAILDSNKNYLIVYPNNDQGSELIFEAYKSFDNVERIKLFPSLRFEYFLTLLKHADFLIGNSSAGIHEAPVYGLHSINIGTRQQNRHTHNSIINVGYETDEIKQAILKVDTLPSPEPSYFFGRGNSAEQFHLIIKGENTWRTSTQKKFCDLW